MGEVYLINELNTNNYKIGATKKEVNKRKYNLQTGNSNELTTITSFKTDEPFKLEKMVHRHFRKHNIHNEWFQLTEELTTTFLDTCKYYNDIIILLKENNPFYK